MVAEGEVERLLMFQDPDDVQTHLPEAYALIRNCTLANVGLNINAGATFWAETQWKEKERKGELNNLNLNGFGLWRKKQEETDSFRKLLNPASQRIAFIAHDDEKPRMSQLIYHYLEQLRSPGLNLTGTSGTCKRAKEYLADRVPHWELPKLIAAGAQNGAGHGPTGGDVVIAKEIIRRWPCDTQKLSSANLGPEKAHKTKPPVRKNGLSHTVVFFIDHRHAQPHEADIHVLLRTCIHPSHGVHILLNERTAREWGDNLRRTGGNGGIG
jgi:methylglyoxal synthase